MPEVISLHHAGSGASARVLTLGFNCFGFCPMVEGVAREVLWSEPGFERGERRASGSGIPVLFPFAGRLTGKQLTFGGRTFSLDSDDGRGNAIHGFVQTREWHVVDRTAASVTGEFLATRDDPSLADRWPSDFRLRATYTLLGQSLEAKFETTNVGRETFPFGLGTHGYFRVPMGDAGRADDCLVCVPAGEYWELVDMLPTTRRLPVDAARDLRGGRRFGDVKLDDVLTGLALDRGKCTTYIADPAARRRLEVEFGAEFPHCVVYNPPHREAICIEPYTTAPDAYLLQDRGVPANLHLLEPGETWSSSMQVRVVATG